MKRNRKGLLLAAALFFAAMAAVSGYQLYKISKEYKAGDEDLRQMYAAMESAGERAKEKTPEMSVGDGQDESREEGETAEAGEDKEASDVRKEEEEARLLQYRELKKANSDVTGWIRVDGTVIDYPVMQTPETPDFYLKRGFDKKYSAYGMIYMDEDCDLDAGCPNFVLYGHHMKNGSMFAALENIRQRNFTGSTRRSSLIPWRRPAGIRWRRCLRYQGPRSPKRLPERSWRPRRRTTTRSSPMQRSTVCMIRGSRPSGRSSFSPWGPANTPMRTGGCLWWGERFQL